MSRRLAAKAAVPVLDYKNREKLKTGATGLCDKKRPRSALLELCTLIVSV
jgi:hypothetical protein